MKKNPLFFSKLTKCFVNIFVHHISLLKFYRFLNSFWYLQCWNPEIMTIPSAVLVQKTQTESSWYDRRDVTSHKMLGKTAVTHSFKMQGNLGLFTQTRAECFKVYIRAGHLKEITFLCFVRKAWSLEAS